MLDDLLGFFGRRSKFGTFFVATGAVVLILGVVLASLNAQALSSIEFRLKPGVEERSDHSFIRTGRPDYQLRVRVDRRWLDLGTKRNSSARDWLVYPVQPDIAESSAIELQLIEADRIESDILDQIQISGPDFQSDQYEYRINTELRWQVGFEWFFDTKLGTAIAIAFAVLIIILVAIALPSEFA